MALVKKENAMTFDTRSLSPIEMIDILSKASHAAIVIASVITAEDTVSFHNSGGQHKLILSFPGGAVQIYRSEDAKDHVVVEINYRHRRGRGKDASEVARLLGGKPVKRKRQEDEASWIVPAPKKL